MRDLLVPITLEYPLSEFLIIEERKDLLTKVGINLEVFGNSGYVIKQLRYGCKILMSKYLLKI